MKQTLALLLALTLLFLCAVGAFAATAPQNPFDRGTLSCSEYRIPALLTLDDGSVVAAADLRWNHGTDAPQNLETGIAVSPDGYGGWRYTVPNYLDDYADGAGSKQSAAYIDSALLQSESGRVFLLADLFLSGTGYPNSQKGSGCVTVDGKSYIALTSKGSSDYSYYIAPFDGDFAPVKQNGRPTGYSVDTQYRLYKDGAALTMAQKGDDDKETGKQIAQSVFYADADLHVFPTPFLCLRHSDDGGKTWSAPTLLSPMVKKQSEAFLGVCPGRGFAVKTDKGERLIFPVYSNENKIEHALTVFSDDGGRTWQRGEDVKCQLMLQKTSESQIVILPDGTLRMFSRNGSHFVSFCDSTDNGQSWTKAKPDYRLLGTKNCMVSFINTSKMIDGKPVVLGSMGSNVQSRADGVVHIGVIEENNKIHWIAATPVNTGFFGYSCLTELADGSFALLFEDEASHFCYRVYTLEADGALVPADGSEPASPGNASFLQKLCRFFADVMLFFQKIFTR